MTEKEKYSQYKSQYTKDHYRVINVSFDINSDADIIEHLDKIKKKNAYIVDLVERDIRKNGMSSDIEEEEKPDLQTIELTSSVSRGCYQGNINIGKAILTDGVKTIGEMGFALCKNLEEVVLTNRVTEIDEWAFAYCESLKAIRVPERIKRIRNNTFLCCHSLEEVILPDKLIEIGDLAFLTCKSLKEIKIPDTLKTIGKMAFKGCKALECVELPASVESIGEEAFSGCRVLKKVVINNKDTKIGLNAFKCRGNYDLEIHCYEGSEAEKYAKEKRINIVLLKG